MAGGGANTGLGSFDLGGEVSLVPSDEEEEGVGEE